MSDRRACGDRRQTPRVGAERRQRDRRAAVTVAALAVAACLASARPASAQIYSWRDANGTLVLSDHPGSPDARTFNVPRTSEVRTTKRPPTIERTGNYDRAIDEHASARGVRPELVRAVIQVESNFNPRARSRKGAQGLMQLMPTTATEMGVLDAFNPIENIRGGIAYLRHLLDKYNNSEELALAAYNAGPDAVNRHGVKIPPYRETQQYVKRILAKTPTPAGPPVIYKTTDVIEGRSVPRYSEKKPASGPYEIVSQR